MVKEPPSNSPDIDLDLRKKVGTEEKFDLSLITLQLGYQIIHKKTFFSKFLKLQKIKIDLDVLAFLLNINDKVEDKGRLVKTSSGKTIEHYNGDIIFFNSVKHKSGNIWLTGDPFSGSGRSNEEQIVIKLDSLDEKYQKVVFAASLFNGRQNQEDLTFLKNSCLRVLDAKGKEITKHFLDPKSNLSGMSSVIFCEIFRRNGSWSFKYIGKPFQTANISNILENYV